MIEFSFTRSTAMLHDPELLVKQGLCYVIVMTSSKPGDVTVCVTLDVTWTFSVTLIEIRYKTDLFEGSLLDCWNLPPNIKL